MYVCFFARILTLILDEYMLVEYVYIHIYTQSLLIVEVDMCVPTLSRLGLTDEMNQVISGSPLSLSLS